MFRKIFILFILFGLSVSQLHSDNEKWYTEYWQRIFLKMWHHGPFNLETYVKLESENHMKNIRLFQLSELFSYDLSDNFSLEFHYTYGHGKPIVKHLPWRWFHRIELEANVKINSPCNSYIFARNRLEIRREQKDPKTCYRFRQLSMLVFSLKNSEILKSFSMYNEVFYDFSKSRFDQDRLCPCKFSFAISKKIELDLFLLFRFIIVDEIWRKSVVVGTQFHF